MSSEGTTLDSASITDLVDTVVQKILSDQRDSETDAESIYRAAIDVVVDSLYESISELAPSQLEEIAQTNNEFIARNEERWGEGFNRLRLFRHLCIEAGQTFQTEFLRHEGYEQDPLLGVLMRLHAHACRVTGEIIALLSAGYPDGALARWRTLHELTVTAILIREHGPQAAVDYGHYGVVQSVDGMNGYQATAEAMNREPYSTEELEAANKLRDSILDSYGDGFKSRNGWARKYIGSSRFANLQRAAGLERWSNDYSIASRDIHTDYREMRSLLAMSEAQHDLLVCGQSNSGMVEPAHSTAIALSQITATFLAAYIEDNDCPIDHTITLVFTKLLRRFEADLGETLLKIHQAASSPDN